MLIKLEGFFVNARPAAHLYRMSLVNKLFALSEAVTLLNNFNILTMQFPSLGRYLVVGAS